MVFVKKHMPFGMQTQTCLVPTQVTQKIGTMVLFSVQESRKSLYQTVQLLNVTLKLIPEAHVLWMKNGDLLQTNLNTSSVVTKQVVMFLTALPANSNSSAT